MFLLPRYVKALAKHLPKCLHKTPVSFLRFCFALSSASPSRTAAVFSRATRDHLDGKHKSLARGACVVLPPARQRHLISSVGVENVSTRPAQRTPPDFFSCFPRFAANFLRFRARRTSLRPRPCVCQRARPRTSLCARPHDEPPNNQNWLGATMFSYSYFPKVSGCFAKVSRCPASVSTLSMPSSSH